MIYIFVITLQKAEVLSNYQEFSLRKVKYAPKHRTYLINNIDIYINIHMYVAFTCIQDTIDTQKMDGIENFTTDYPNPFQPTC
jgi:hypothetical protein